MRLFIAATFPQTVLSDLNDRVARFRSRVPQASWVRPETQHLTLAFLGERDEQLVPRIRTLVEEELASVSRFEARLTGCGFFPNSRNARVAWVGASPEKEFLATAAAVRKGVTAAGIELDRADFRAHLTLCRIREHWPPSCVETFMTALGTYESAAFPVTELTLFSSQLNPDGAVHTPVAKLSLA